MAIFFYFLLVTMLLVFNKSKSLQVVSLLYLFILFAFSYYCADRVWYETKLNNFNEMSSMTEPGFYYFMVFLNRFGLSVQYECIIIAVVYLSTLYLLSRKLSKYAGYILSMYMIANFFMDVVQLRFTLSLAFVYWGIYYLINDDKSNSSTYIRFIVFILAASLIHISSIWFAILLFAKKLSVKEVILLSIVIIFSSFFLVGILPMILGNFYLYDMISIVLDAGESEYTKKDILWRGYMIIFDSLCFIYIFGRIIKNRNIGSKLIRYNTMGIKICILQVILVPMLFVSANFHRLSLALLPILFIIVSRNFAHIKSKGYIYALSCILSFYAFIKYTIGAGIGLGGLYIPNSNESNLNLVFLSIFDNNLLFDLFS